MCLQLNADLESSQSRVGSPSLSLLVQALHVPLFPGRVEEVGTGPPCPGAQAVAAQNSGAFPSTHLRPEVRVLAPWQ